MTVLLTRPRSCKRTQCCCGLVAGLLSALGLRGSPRDKRPTSTVFTQSQAEITKTEDGIPSTKVVTMPATMDGESHAEKQALKSNNTTSTTVNGYSHSEYQQITIIKELTPKVHSKLQSELGSSTDGSLSGNISLESFLDYVAAERLRRMPHRGSRWDKVLKWAEHFASQVSAYQHNVGTWLPYSNEAAQLVMGGCRTLLEMGPSQGVALERAFGVFYQLGLTLSFFLRNRSLFAISGDIRQELGHAYADLLALVIDVTVYYRKRSKDKSSTIATMDFDSHFGRIVDVFFQRRDQIANDMWTHQLRELAGSENTTVDINVIRQWLAPQDRTLQILSSNRMGTRGFRDEFTCEWFQKHLLDFVRSKDDVLAISGQPGSGKSTLSSWIVERLQRPLGRRSYETITYVIDADVPSQATTMNLVKGLLLQLLEQSVGDISLYRSLVAVIEASKRTKNAAEVESALWKALDTALKTSKNLVIIVDGLDEIKGGESTALRLFEKLHQLSAQHNTVKTITLSRLSKLTKPSRQFNIDATHTRDDLYHFVDRSLNSYQHFHVQKQNDKEATIERVTQSANGSFIWAGLAVEIIKNETTHAGFVNALQNVPQSLAELLQLMTSTFDFNKQDTKRVVSWLVVAERPLSIVELQALLGIDTDPSKHATKHSATEEEIRRAFGPLVTIRDGICRFRHGTVRQHLLDLSAQGKSLMAPKDAQNDLITRTLTYVKEYLTRRNEPSFEPLESQALDELFQSHRLLEYTVRYWTVHFQHSSMYRQDGSHNYLADFKLSLPNSSLMALIEGSCWETQTSTYDAIDMHNLALNIRQSVLGPSEAVIQAQITIASTYEKISKLEEASSYYYHSSRISQTVLSRQSTVAVTCATAYLKCTTSITTKSRTEVAVRREESLKYVIEVETHIHSKTSELVIKYKKALAQLYVDIQETELAATTYREVYEACVERYGQHSEEVKSVSQSLTVVLQKESNQTDVVEYTKSVFEIAERTMDLIDIRRITATIRFAKAYESKMDFIEAEELLITLFRRVTEVCRVMRTTECHERKIEVILEYVRFLRRQQRIAEAESILIGLWAEYEHEEIKSEAVIVRIKSIGEEMRAVGMVTIALSIFSSVWSYFKKIGRQTSTEATSTAVMLADITQEINVSTETSTEISFQETVLREVFESSISSSTATKVERTSVKTCETLSTHYAKNERWTEASSICQSLLRKVWSNLFVADQRSIVLPKDFTSETVEITKRLAYYYVKERRFEEAEKIYVYIFRATKSNLHIQDDLVVEAGQALFKFYEDVNQISKAISVYKELAEAYSKTLGSTHALTIKILYQLGDLCTKHKSKDSERYYIEITTSLNKGSEICHADAMEAAIVLSRLYYDEKRWTEAHKFYSALWLTFIKKGKEYNMSSESVETIYRRHVYILEKEVKVEYSVLHQVAVEYRETCTKVFGAHSEITLKATMQLAEVSEKSEKYQQEAILIYEEVFSSTKQTTTTTTMSRVLTEAKQRLAHLYVTTESSTSKHSEKAVTLHLEQYKSMKIEYGCSHKSTLTKLKELITLYKKQNTQQFHSAATRELQSFTIELITTVKDSKKLFDSGSVLANIYKSCGFVEHGFELLKGLRQQFIVRGTKSSLDPGFDVSSIDRRSYIFLVVFEETLKGTKRISYSEVMADLLTESILYEHYNKSVQRQTSFEYILVHGARLRSFLFEKKRQDQATALEDDLLEMFLANMGSGITTERRVTRILFIALLEELGKDKHEVRLANAACITGNHQVLASLNKSKFQEAYELALCVYQFVNHRHGYHDNHNYDYGLKLALYMAGRGAKKCPESALYSQMLELSKNILRAALHACESLDIKFVEIQVTELNDLVGLMGEQRNFNDLEWLLTELWNNRQSRASWSSATIVGIGRRLVEVRFAHKHRDSAIHLCEDIVYNLRRVYGALDTTTLEMSTLLSHLYTTAGRYHKAMGLSEEILREEISGDDDDANGHDATQAALTHLELLKRSYQRQGGWEKDASNYKDLFSQVMHSFGHEKKPVDVFGQQMTFQNVQPIEKWSAKGADNMGTFIAPTTWEFMSRDEERKHHNLLRRTSENYALNGANGKNGTQPHVHVRA